MRQVCAGLLSAMLLLGPGSAAPLDPAEQQRFADGLYARGLHDMALQEYERLLDAHPNLSGRSVALYRAGEAARKLGRPDADQWFERCVAAGEPGDAQHRARLRLAASYLQQNQARKALEHSEALLRAMPPDDLAAAGLYYQGQALFRLGESRKGADLFRALIARYPEDTFSSYAGLLLAKQENTDPEERKAFYRQVLRSPPSADVEVEALWGLAAVESDQGNYAKAAEQFKRLSAKHPDARRVREGALTIAWCFFRAERYADALAVSLRTPESAKQDQLPTWLYLDGTCLRLTGSTDEALKRLEDLTGRFPTHAYSALASYDMAVIHFERRAYAKVLNLAEPMLRSPEHRESGLWLLAESSRADDKPEQALAYYDQIAREFPKGERVADSRYNRAVVLQKIKPLEAAEAFVQFAKSFPADERIAPALSSAGSLRLEAGEREAARDAWAELVRLGPNMPGVPDLQFRLGLLELQLGRKPEAFHTLDAYAARQPPPPRLAEASYWLAVLSEERGAPREAERRLQSALTHGVPEYLVGKTRTRLALLLQKEARTVESIEVLVPLCGSAAAEELPDAMLVWMLRSLHEHPDAQVHLPAVANEMTRSTRGSATRELGYYALGKRAEEQKQFADARRAYQDGLKLGGGSVEAAEAALALGGLLFADGKATEALPLYTRGAETASSVQRVDLQARGWFGMARCYDQLGNSAEAARFYMSIVVLYDDPELTPASLFHAAAAFRKAGQEEKAVQALDELKTRYPQSSWNEPKIDN